MEEFITIADVPVFDAHDKFDEKALNEIIANCNKRIADTGDYSPIVIGHTDDEAPESEQPEVVGFAGPFKLGTIGKVKKRKAILARFRFFKSKYQIAKQYPRRSIELWTKDKVIDPISLLSASAPARDLGLLFSKNKSEKIKYQLKEPMNTELIDKLVEAFKDFLHSKMSEDVEAPEQMEEEGAPMVEEPKQEPAKMEEAEQVEPEQEEKKPEKLRQQRDQARTEVTKYQREHESMKAELETLHRKFRRAERERDLMQLAHEGFVIDVPEELDSVQDLDVTKYGKHIERIRKRYSRSPIGVNIQPAHVADFGGEKEFTQADMRKAVSLAQTKGMRYEDALSQVKGGKV